jgi:hypothetical protein
MQVAVVMRGGTHEEVGTREHGPTWPSGLDHGERSAGQKWVTGSVAWSPNSHRLGSQSVGPCLFLLPPPLVPNATSTLAAARSCSWFSQSDASSGFGILGKLTQLGVTSDSHSTSPGCPAVPGEVGLWFQLPCQPRYLPSSAPPVDSGRFLCTSSPHQNHRRLLWSGALSA